MRDFEHLARRDYLTVPVLARELEGGAGAGHRRKGEEQAAELDDRVRASKEERRRRRERHDEHPSAGKPALRQSGRPRKDVLWWFRCPAVCRSCSLGSLHLLLCAFAFRGRVLVHLSSTVCIPTAEGIAGKMRITRTVLLALHVSFMPSLDANAGRELIKIEGGFREDDANLNADDFMWEKLPGRCCFYGGPNTKHPAEWLGARTCDACTVWDLPDNFCHSSEAACKDCGMSLYCSPLPPLIAGNKVCTGSSRVGRGCEDVLGTGVCASHSVSECQQACRTTHHCEMLVFYPREKAGTCILCRDMQNFEETLLESTRVYANTAAPPPPSPPKGLERHYALIEAPSPPPPPNPPPRPPLHPPRKLAHLGRAHTGQHFECRYQPQTELATQTGRGYTDRQAASKEECCNLCGLKSGCDDFVFEPSSGTCVLLPHTPSAQIKRMPNQYTVAGSLSISVVRKADGRHGSCEYLANSGYSGGALGEAVPALGGAPIEDKLDCCDACDRNPLCDKFTYQPDGKTCLMYKGFAELYQTDSLLSGIITSRYNPMKSQYVGTVASPTAIQDHSWGYTLPPTTPPQWVLRPDHDSGLSRVIEADSQGLTELVGDMSLGIAAMMALVLVTCMYCFFREDFISLADQIVGGKLRGHGAKYMPPKDNLRQQRRRTKRGTKLSSDGMAEGCIDVRLETRNVTQKKEVFVGDVSSIDELLLVLAEEFVAVLKKKRLHDMLLFAEDLDPDEGVARWMLVTDSSDLSQVVLCSSLKMVEKSRKHDTAGFEVAFPHNSGERRRISRPSRGCSRTVDRARPGGDAHRGAKAERFSDDVED